MQAHLGQLVLRLKQRELDIEQRHHVDRTFPQANLCYLVGPARRRHGGQLQFFMNGGLLDRDQRILHIRQPLDDALAVDFQRLDLAPLGGLELPDAVAQTPASSSSDGKSESGLHWWWLALVPLLGLLGLLAVLAQRRSGPQREVLERDRYVSEADDDYWPGTRIRHDEIRYDDDDDTRDLGVWSPPGRARVESEVRVESEFDSDEDRIDTAPTRIPGIDYEEPDYPEYAEDRSPEPQWRFEAPPTLAAPADDMFGAGGGRHSAGTAVSAAAWRLELDEIANRPRRRHAVDEFEVEVRSDVVEEVRPEATGAPEPEATWAPEPEATWAPEPRATASSAPAEDPWRPAIHLPLADPFQAPAGYVLKGNTHSGLYYTPDSVLYENTIPEVWFASEELAQSNGFVKAPE